MARELPRIFDYFDYTAYLRDYYTARHAVDFWFSYRYLQDKAGIDPGYLVKVFNGQRHLSARRVPPLAQALKLNKKETEYFALLVDFAKAKTAETSRLYFEKLLRYTDLGARVVDADMYEYYTKWYNVAIRNILSYFPVKDDFKALARMTVPPITAHEAKRSVRLLEKLGLVHKDAHGYYRQVEKLVTTGEEWKSMAIRRFQKDTIALAARALDEIPKEERDISTVTLTLSQESLDKARELTKEYRRNLLELAKSTADPEGAYHVNIQIIPIGARVEEARE
jgi:uncharacterized protein (TIGR02147 family)